MSDFKSYKITDGVELVAVEADRFKANRIDVSFAVDLSEKTACIYALAVSMITNCSEEYPDITAINKKLALLYGASLSSSIVKVGDAQVLTVHLSSLDDRFSLGDDISSQSIDMLLSVIFRPRLNENGDFFEEDIQREKRILIEKIEAEQNEKRLYSLRRAESIMFEGEPYAVNAYGKIEDIEKISSDDIKAALNQMISGAKIQITVVGNANITRIKEKLTDAFSEVNRSYQPLSEPVIVKKAEKVKDVSERMEVKQGKLVLGYRVNVDPDDEKHLAVRAFCDAFGGGPYSKLFANVREKLSLCYYCSAQYIRQKSCVMIQCGCEEQNMDKAIEEINNQIQEIINGDFETEFASSKIGLSDFIRSANDDSALLSMWYARQIVNKDILSPDESAKQNDMVKLSDAIDCADLLSLDTIYRLLSK